MSSVSDPQRSPPLGSIPQEQESARSSNDSQRGEAMSQTEDEDTPQGTARQNVLDEREGQSEQLKGDRVDKEPKWVDTSSLKYNGSEVYPSDFGLDMLWPRDPNRPDFVPTMESIEASIPVLPTEFITREPPPGHIERALGIPASRPPQKVDPEELRELEHASAIAALKRSGRPTDLAMIANTRGPPRKISSSELLRFMRSPEFKVPVFMDIAPQDLFRTAMAPLLASQSGPGERGHGQDQATSNQMRDNVETLEQELKASKKTLEALMASRSEEKALAESLIQDLNKQLNDYKNKLDDTEAELSRRQSEFNSLYDVGAEKEEECDKLKRSNDLLSKEIRYLKSLRAASTAQGSASMDPEQELHKLRKENMKKDAKISSLTDDLQDEQRVSADWNKANKMLHDRLVHAEKELPRFRDLVYDLSYHSLRYKGGVDKMNDLDGLRQDIEAEVAMIQEDLAANPEEAMETEKQPKSPLLVDDDTKKNLSTIKELQHSLKKMTDKHKAKEEELRSAEQAFLVQIQSLKNQAGGDIPTQATSPMGVAVAVVSNEATNRKKKAWFSIPSATASINIRPFRWFTGSSEQPDSTRVLEQQSQAKGAKDNADRSTTRTKESSKPDPSDEAMMELDRKWAANPELTIQELVSKDPPYSTSTPVGEGQGRIPENQRAGRNLASANKASSTEQPRSTGMYWKGECSGLDWAHVVLVVAVTACLTCTYWALSERKIWLDANDVTQYIFWHLLRGETLAISGSLWCELKARNTGMDRHLYQGIRYFG